MTVMFALADPSPTSTSYGALYLASQIYVYRWPLWVKVMFTSEKKTLMVTMVVVMMTMKVGKGVTVISRVSPSAATDCLVSLQVT